MTASAALPALPTAYILAGGLGTRLRPAVEGRPKPLAEVGGRPFLTYLLEDLARQGVRRAVLCTGYLGDQIEAHFGDHLGPLSLVYSQEPAPLGTGGALALALHRHPAPLALILNGDSFVRADLPAFFAWYQARRVRHGILAVRVPDTQRYGSLELGPDDQVLAFLEKGRQGPGLVNAGIYLLESTLFEDLPLDRPTRLEQDIFAHLAGGPLHACPSDGPLLDIGTPASYAEAEAFFLSPPGGQHP